MYDVILIGAGPAGTTAAKRLAENGYKTLLTEKFRLPREKSCSGQLIQKTLNLVQTYFGEPVPAFVQCAPEECRGMIFTDENGQEFRFEQPGKNVWRSSFDQWLAEKAVQAGAELRDGAAAISCTEGDAIVNVTFQGTLPVTEQARFVILCEGAAGILKRKLRNRTPPFVTTYQTFSRGTSDLDPHYFYAYLQPEFSGYDAWFNVKDHQPVVGVAARDRKKIPYYYENFLSYLKKTHHLCIEQTLRSESWILPQVFPECGIDYGTDRILFAGEAAGFLNPMGEGISAAMESGFGAANAIIQNFYHPACVSAAYARNCEELHQYMKRQWDFLSRMSKTFQDRNAGIRKI